MYMYKYMYVCVYNLINETYMYNFIYIMLLMLDMYSNTK